MKSSPCRRIRGEVGSPERLGLHLGLDLGRSAFASAPLGLARLAAAGMPQHGLVGQDLLVDDPAVRRRMSLMWSLSPSLGVTLMGVLGRPPWWSRGFRGEP